MDYSQLLQPPQRPDEVGRLEGYRVLGVIGAGTMGIVFKAEDVNTGQLMALKTMQPALAGSSTAQMRFLREARAGAACVHENIITLYMVGEDHGVAFLGMELLVGETLAHRLQRAGKLPMKEIIAIGRQIAAGLEHVHRLGILHRDIEPGNIFLEDQKGSSGKVKIIDFGLARAMDIAAPAQTGPILGTPGYMSPEQAVGHFLDARSDLFSLGCVMYHMCTGEEPFTGTDMASTLLAVCTLDPSAPREVNADVSQALSDLVMDLLRKNPMHRPTSAHQVLQAFTALPI